MRLAFLLAPLLIASPSAPKWSKTELKELISRVQRAAGAPSVAEQDAALLKVAAKAYRKTPSPGASVESGAKAILRARDPQHPAVKKGQWMLALSRQFYLDVHKRLDTLARFETNPRDEKWMKSMAQQTLLVAREIEKSLELVVEGLEGGVEPLANVGGDEPKRRGAFVKVSAGGKIAIEELNRVTFENHQPPPDRPRTKRGSLRELYSAQKQYQTSAAMLGRYDPVWRKNKGHVQVVVPAAYPAIYLNEIVRGSIEAKMKFLHVMTMSKRGELRELVLRLDKPKKKKRKKPFKEVRCKDEISMQDCARRIKHALGQGSARFVVD